MLNHKVAIVTGASRGIGRAIAIALADEGAQVFAVSRSSKNDMVKDERIILLSADVAEPDQVQAVVQEALSQSGGIDILVNNAGVEYFKSISETSFEEYNRMLNTNLRGSFLFTKAIIPGMIARNNGQIVFINSVSGLRGFAQDSIYCASKHGQAGLADALDEELRPHGIRVSSIFPGATNTDLSVQSWAPANDPKRRYFLKPEDIARAVLYIMNQPPEVVVSQIVIRPFIEMPYSDFLPTTLLDDLIR
ncbi:MAG: SDR family oxidoreductase [Anaerolineales bacterium]